LNHIISRTYSLIGSLISVTLPTFQLPRYWLKLVALATIPRMLGPNWHSNYQWTGKMVPWWNMYPMLATLLTFQLQKSLVETGRIIKHCKHTSAANIRVILALFAPPVHQKMHC
jgi:hypothetical protein